MYIFTCKLRLSPQNVVHAGCNSQHWCPAVLLAFLSRQPLHPYSIPLKHEDSTVMAESAVRAKEKIEVFLPPVAEILAPEFVGLASNLAYVVDFRDNRPAFASSANTFTIDTRAGKFQLSYLHLQMPSNVLDLETVVC